jgi:hypothetical protein
MVGGAGSSMKSAHLYSAMHACSNFAQLWATDWMADGSEFESLEEQDCSLLHVVQTGSGAQRSPLSNGYWGLFPSEVKRPGREADHSPPTSAEFKNTWIYTPTSPYVVTP